MLSEPEALFTSRPLMKARISGILKDRSDKQGSGGGFRPVSCQVQYPGGQVQTLKRIYLLNRFAIAWRVSGDILGRLGSWTPVTGSMVAKRFWTAIHVISKFASILTKTALC